MFTWVRQVQDDEEKDRDIQSKKVKLEAALFKRHQKEVASRVREMKAQEDVKRQEEYLNQAYLASLSEEEEEARWDPIEDVVMNDRGNYVDLIQYFLMLKDDDVESAKPEEATPNNSDRTEAETVNDMTTQEKKTPKKKSKKTKSGTSSSMEEGKGQDQDSKSHQIVMETGSQLRQRLRDGVEFTEAKGILVKGTIRNPIEISNRTAPFPDDEIEVLLREIAEVKHLLFCRLLLAHADLLPAAIRASSVEDFLNDSEVAAADLRDLCLKMEKPGLEEVRDACADLFRNDGENEDDLGDKDDPNGKDSKPTFPMGPRPEMPEFWRNMREKSSAAAVLAVKRFLATAMVLLSILGSLIMKKNSSTNRCASRSAASSFTITGRKSPWTEGVGCTSVSSLKNVT